MAVIVVDAATESHLQAGRSQHRASMGLFWRVVSPPGELRVAPGRRVVLDAEAGVVTKVFRHPRAKWRDRHRAKCEERVLRGLAERGVRVPEWLATERLADGAWAVQIRAVPGARTVLECLTPAGPPGLMASAGRLLASLHTAGLDQPDLHAGNALVDGAGALWAIDFHAAELGTEVGLGVLLRDLVKLCGAHRETVALRARQRCFIAWWRALEPRLRELLPPRGDLAASIEERGRRARIATCMGYAKPSSRFFRRSSSMRAANEGDGARLLVRVGASDERVAAALALLEGGAQDARFVHVEGAREVVEATWGRAARLASHGLPGARPLVLDRRVARRAQAVLDWDPAVPDGGRELASVRAPSVVPSKRAALDAALAFRGLALRAPGAADFRMLGEHVLLAPSARLVTADELAALRASNAKRRTRRARWLAAWPRLCQGPWQPVTRLAIAGVVRGLRLSPVEAKLRRHLEPVLANLAPARAGDLTPGIRRHMGHLFLEWGRMGAPGFADELFERVQPDASLAQHAELLRGGALVITPHLGNWEWLAAYLAHHGLGRGQGLPGAVVGRLRRRDPIAAHLKTQRARAGVETLAQDTHPRELLRRLARGQVIGLLPDLEVSRLAGIRLPFLGREALVMTAPAALARAAKKPLLPAANLRQPDGTYRLVFGDPIPPPASKADTRATTQAWIAVFEAWIRAHPDQWLWIHDRWRSPASPTDAAPLMPSRSPDPAPPAS